MPRPKTIVAILWKLPIMDRDAINRSAVRRGLSQPDYLAWCVATAEKASPLHSKLELEPIPEDLRKQFELAFRPALEKHTEHMTVEERIAALREVVQALGRWADEVSLVLRARWDS